jgi:hypothetical protein
MSVLIVDPEPFIFQFPATMILRISVSWLMAGRGARKDTGSRFPLQGNGGAMGGAPGML